MYKLILTYGSIIGAVIIGVVIISMNIAAGDSNHVAGEVWLGYLIQVIAFSMIFIAVKRYRDQELGGVITFGKAFKIGLGISINAAIIYVAAWEVNLSMTDYAFIHNYAEGLIESAKASGATAQEIKDLEEATELVISQYSNTFVRLLITLSEILPTGIVISLICAAILKKN